MATTTTSSLRSSPSSSSSSSSSSQVLKKDEDDEADGDVDSVPVIWRQTNGVKCRSGCQVVKNGTGAKVKNGSTTANGETMSSSSSSAVSGLRSRRHRRTNSEVQQEVLVQGSNVPRSFSTSSTGGGSDHEELSRLKSACHAAWRKNFGNHRPLLMNNNEMGKETIREEKADAVFQNQYFSQQEEKDSSSRTPQRVDREHKRHQSLGWWRRFLTRVASLLSQFLTTILVTFVVIFTLYCVMVLHKPTQAFLSRHTQDLIYPFMRSIRFASLPFVTTFPQLHELYEDACVLGNPFFEMNDVSCWPCESVRHVIDLTGFSNFTSGYYHSGIPFIVKDAFSQDVGIEDIYKLSRENSKFSGSILLQSSDAKIKTFDDLIRYNVKSGNFFSGNLHVVWKINRVQYARQMRKSFSRPYYIPNSTEISVQHFLFIDEPSAEQYPFPVTEFANVFVMQSEGRRLIVLVPVRHCRTTCKAISVVLQPKDVLFYNWLFWRPISFPMKALEENKELSMTYVGSFY